MAHDWPMRLAATLALAACAAPPPPPPLSGHATAPPPTGPEPTVRWAGRDVQITGLPAISADGATLVIAHRDNDSGRGNPNLTLVEKDRKDRVVSRLVVLTANEADQLDAAQIDERFARAARWLHDRRVARSLVAMTPLVLGKPAGAASSPAGGLTLRWTPNWLVIEREPAASVVRATPATWLAPDHPMCHNCTEICHNEAFLGGGYVDLKRSIAIVVVAFRGTDTCWEPSSEHHVVAW